MENQKETKAKKEKFVDKSIHQEHNGSKPVGYGSSIQNSGHGNKTRPIDPNEKLPSSNEFENQVAGE